MAALNAALALAEMHNIATRIRNELHLDMTSRVNSLLQVHAIIAKSAFSLAARRAQRGWQVLRVTHKANALAASAGRGLQQQRIANLCGNFRNLGIIQLVSHGSRHNRHPYFSRRIARRRLLTDRALYSRRRSYKNQFCLSTGLYERGILRQKAIAGMDGLRPRAPGNLDNRRNMQVTLRGLRWPYMIRLVCHTHV